MGLGHPETRHAWVYRDSMPAATRETGAMHSDLLPGIEIPLDEILWPAHSVDSLRGVA
ncbi:MAG: hypothetical protein NTW28_19075 [Candidatus Solibacter sp.]|nr:hypothetical protein [Candidatus Solibacter sp.]